MPALKQFALCLLLVASPALADGKGIRFDEMPVGCRIHGSYSTGEKVIDVYVGKSGPLHVVKTYGGRDGKDLVRTSTYSRDGLLLRKDWTGGAWESFSPASCINVPGPCSYTYRNGDGADLTYKGANTAKGDTVTSKGGFVGEAPFNAVVATIGAFNASVAFVEGDFWFEVTKYEGCDLGS